MPIEKVLPLISFAFGVGAFIANLLPPSFSRGRSFLVVLLAGLLAFVATDSASIWQTQQRSWHVRAVSEELLGLLTNEAKSLDQLHEGLPFEDLGTVSDALAALVRERKVTHKVVDVRDEANLRYRARLYFSR
jgi:hypothetical protein